MIHSLPSRKFCNAELFSININVPTVANARANHLALGTVCNSFTGMLSTTPLYTRGTIDVEREQMALLVGLTFRTLVHITVSNESDAER
jgi:hypothetical protein